MTDWDRRPPMRVIVEPLLAGLPVRAVVARASGHIVLRPALGHAEAVAVIRTLLPNAHLDAVEHWVEAVLPTTEPLWKVARRGR